MSLQNNIASEQNSARKLDQLAAKTELYAGTEKLELLQACLPIFNAVIWPPLLAWKPGLSVWSALSGFAVPVFDAVACEPLQALWKRQAANIQELFDCELLGLAWNPVGIGEQPNEEEVAEYARRFRRKGGDESKLKDWYSFKFEDLPLPFARLICQRSNCWWDAKLRRYYANVIVALTSILAVFALAIGLVAGLTLEKFILAVVAPIAPMCLWGIREFKRQRSAAEEGDRLLRQAEAVWREGYNGKLSKPELEKASRDLQVHIYHRRRSTPVIPAWLYSLHRTEYQELMVKGGNEMIARYRTKHDQRSQE